MRRRRPRYAPGPTGSRYTPSPGSPAAHFHLGAWDEAIVDADRAVTLLSETEHEWLRPLVHWVAAAVPAARGDWATADQHAAAAAAGNTAYELMLLCGGMAKAQVAAAHGDHDGVLEALEPVLTLMPRQGIEEPGSGRGSTSTSTH